MKKLMVLSLLVLISGIAFSQKTEIKPFYIVDAFGPFEIELIASDKNAIEMELVNVREEDIEMDVRRGELTLKLRSRHYWKDWDNHKFRHSQYIKTKIYFKELEEVRASAGATVSANETLRGKKLVFIGNMGATMKLSVVADNVYAKASMGAEIYLSGRTNFIEVKGNMGGSIKASRLESKSAYAKANMGSEITLYASEEIDIDANFGSSVRYEGDPSVRHTSRKMGADIRKK